MSDLNALNALSANGNATENAGFSAKLDQLRSRHTALITRPNEQDTSWYNGVFNRYRYPVLTAQHTPLFWRYDLNGDFNPDLIETLGVNSVFNPGAIALDGKILMVARVEGYDRKSFFAVAESESGVDGFRFWDYPIDLPETDVPDDNVYDMRLTRHEDGWIYGLFCVERKDPNAPAGDLSRAIAQCGIARTHDLVNWERLPDLVSRSPQQRNVVLHPEFVDGRYALYTRPQDGFIEAGSGLGIGWALADSMESAKIEEEAILDPRVYHTIKESKNGQGPPPIKTDLGWLHIAHGVRQSADGLRYVLYVFMTSLDDPSRVIHRPGGYFLSTLGRERTGDLCNVAFINGWVERDGKVYIYYATGDTEVNVATSSVEQLLHYATKTPEDPLTARRCLDQRIDLIKRNLQQAGTGESPQQGEQSGDSAALEESSV